MNREEILALLSKLDLQENTLTVTKIRKSDVNDGIQKNKNSLVGKFLTNKELQAKNYRPAMEKSWQTKKFKIVKLGQNYFQFLFEEETDLRRVQAEGPWCFDNYLLVLKPWRADLQESSKDFEEAVFWIQVWHLPIHCYTIEVGKKIAMTMKDCSFLQLREDIATSQPLFRFRASISLVKPLSQLLTLLFDETPSLSKPEPIIGLFKYEHIPYFCYHCGLMGHVAKNCPEVSEEFSMEDEKSFRFGKQLIGSNKPKLIQEQRLLDMDTQPLYTTTPSQTQLLLPSSSSRQKQIFSNPQSTIVSSKRNTYVYHLSMV